MTEWLAVRNLSHTFAGNRPALQDITLRLNEGVTALLGPNGSGKSTLLRCLAGVIAPGAGTVSRNGVNIWQDITRYHWELGYLPQEFAGPGHMSVREFLGYMAALKLIPARLVGQRVEELLGWFGLRPHSRTRLARLSRGQLRRVGLAQALLSDPNLLILDEPTVDLDPEERLALLERLRDLARERIVIMATHLTADAEAAADRLLILQEGRLLAHTAAAELVNRCRGQVWEMESAEPFTPPVGALITRVAHSGSGIRTRLVSQTKPHTAAVTCMPSLEDAYLAVSHRLIQA